MDNFKQSLRTFEAALKKKALAKDPADAYVDEVEKFVKSELKTLLNKVTKLLNEGKRMHLRYETDRLERLEGAIENFIESYE
jgi:hypothetical protein